MIFRRATATMKTSSAAIVLPSAVCVLAFLSLAGIAGSLQCLCKGDCEGRETETCEGDICYAQAVVEFTGTISRRWRCLPKMDDYLCNTSSAFHTTVCCEHKDFCNENIFPTIPPEAPITDPTPSEEPDECATEFTVPFGNPIESQSCFKSSSKRDDVRLCTLTSSCYTTIRRAGDGSLSYDRGCSVETCIPESRNRKLKLCCSSSLCNDRIPSLDDVSIPYTGDLLSLLGNSTDNDDEEEDTAPRTRCGGKRADPVSTAIPPLLPVTTQSSLQSSISVTKTSLVVSVTTSTSYLVTPESPIPKTDQPATSDETLFYILTAVVLTVFGIIQVPLICMFILICKRRRKLNKIKKGQSVTSASELPIHT